MSNSLPETMDERAAKARLDELGASRSTDAVAERAELLRVLGRLDEALATAEESYRLAVFTGDRAQVTTARLRRARVLHDKGSLDRALTEVTACRLSARTEGWGEVEASALYQQSSVLVDLGRLGEAKTAITELIELRAAQQAPSEQLSALNGALEVITRRILSESA
jgi:ATP/maltotriose-dependent transcriptional regulator MalT